MSRFVRSLALAALCGVVLAGCATSPTTSIARDDGTKVTVDWADYPGAAGLEAAEILAAPPEGEAERAAAELFEAVRAALDEDFDFSWSMTGEDGWYPGGGNGYGGESALITYNSRSLETRSVPTSTTDWEAIIDRVSAITEAKGLGPVLLDHEVPPSGANESAWRKDLKDRFGTDDPDEYWLWNGTAYKDSQWFAVSILDGNRDPTGHAAEEFSDDPNEGRSIGFFYGVTTIPDDERDAFLRALEPFEGLEKPPATGSD